ncbi:hypothetical protein GWK47_012675 [Chionoecetes opilio]|uniref:Uncharacterized protein n=1 Tax=Chionoecetes opilio TaxID=41210 RepID=A0A8J4XX38_CHIOP|nr:hypothetical protein GWK47_012675 [Chionoecetes opilio]
MIDVGKLVRYWGAGVCSAFPGVHAWSGCDMLVPGYPGKDKGVLSFFKRKDCIFKHSQIWVFGNVPTTSSKAFTLSVSCTPGKRRSLGANSLLSHVVPKKRGRSKTGNCRLGKSLMRIPLGPNIRGYWRRALKTAESQPISRTWWETHDGGSSKTDEWRVYQLPSRLEFTHARRRRVDRRFLLQEWV